jgi:ribosomal protein L32
MGFKQRERKRRQRVAIKRAQANARRAGSRSKWWLTLVVRACSCNECGGALRPGRECVYRHSPREVLCRDCAEDRGLQSRPSQRWEESRRKSRSAVDPCS